MDTQQDNTSQGLTTKILVDTVQKFSRTQLGMVIGFTFNFSAWQSIKHKFKETNIPGNVNIFGLPCYVLAKQEEDCIGWYNKEMMMMYVDSGGDKKIEQLPIVKK
jgi:hypothetical protein